MGYNGIIVRFFFPSQKIVHCGNLWVRFSCQISKSPLMFGEKGDIIRESLAGAFSISLTGVDRIRVEQCAWRKKAVNIDELDKKHQA
jgi:hypothetical protein